MAIYVPGIGVVVTTGIPRQIFIPPVVIGAGIIIGAAATAVAITGGEIQKAIERNRRRNQPQPPAPPNAIGGENDQQLPQRPDMLPMWDADP